MSNIIEQKFLFWEFILVDDIITPNSSCTSFVSKVKVKTVIYNLKFDDWYVSGHFATTDLNINYYIDFYLSKQSQNQDRFAKMLNEGCRVTSKAI